MSKAVGLDNGLTNYGDRDFARYLRRSFARSTGLSTELLDKPVVGIAMTPSGFNNCHRYMPQLVEAVSRGVLAAGALPLPFPTISLGEVFLSPTSMMFRNLMSMDTEEMIRAQPMDAVVLIGGCDKTVPAQLMGAASAGRPAIQLVTGPMTTGRHRGQRLGACTDCRSFWAKYRAGSVDADEIEAVEGRLSVTAGTCAVMGTASTMACIAETLGMSLPGHGGDPRRRFRPAGGRGRDRQGGRAPDPRPDHAGPDHHRAVGRERLSRADGPRRLDQRHRPSDRDRRAPRHRHPDGAAERDLGRDPGAGRPEAGRRGLHGRLPRRRRRAGGAAGAAAAAAPRLPGGGRPHPARAAGRARGWVDRKIIRPFAEPISPVGGLIALHGSLAPDGAILKRAAATPALFEVEGRAVVFEGLEDLSSRIDDPDLDVTPHDILVLKNAGPHAAGMPEAGYLPIPAKLARAGVKDMVRISDARMSGTAYGTIVLHAAPEAAVGGPLAAVRNGDRIALSVQRKRLDLLVEEREIQRRLESWSPPPVPERGYRALFRRSVLQAPQGCDFDFLTKAPGHG